MSESAGPGWYHAEGDPPNTERYWDGFAWTEGPRPIAPPAGSTPVDDLSIDTPLVPDDDSTTASGDETWMSSPDSGESDAPTGASPTNMPVMGSTTSGGLDDGFPSMDDPPSMGSYGAGESTIPASAPGAFGDAPSASPPGFPPQQSDPFGGTPAAGGFPGAPAGGFGGVYPEQSQAVTALVLAIVGLFCCGLPAAVGAYFGYAEKNGIDAGQRDPSNRGVAIASMVIGGIAAVLWGFIFVLFIIGVMLG